MLAVYLHFWRFTYQCLADGLEILLTYLCLMTTIKKLCTMVLSHRAISNRQLLDGAEIAV